MLYIADFRSEYPIRITHISAPLLRHLPSPFCSIDVLDILSPVCCSLYLPRSPTQPPSQTTPAPVHCPYISGPTKALMVEENTPSPNGASSTATRRASEHTGNVLVAHTGRNVGQAGMQRWTQGCSCSCYADQRW